MLPNTIAQNSLFIPNFHSKQLINSSQQQQSIYSPNNNLEIILLFAKHHHCSATKILFIMG
jgi:hypothetical protein